MRVSGLSTDGDWRFGRGLAVYKRRSEAVKQRVVTRLRLFTDDWFADISNGIPWIEIFGTKQQEKRMLREIESTVLSTDGVKSIQRLELVDVDKRHARVELTYTDLFNRQLSETVSIV